MTEEPAPARRRFTRFSLLSFLLLTGLIGVSVSHFRLTAENRQLKMRNNELRSELGFIEIEDPDKAYVKSLESLEALKWRVRVYLPPNKPYYLHVAHEWVDQGIPRALSATGPIRSDGEFTLTAGLSQDASGMWQMRIAIPGSGHTSTFQKERSEWLTEAGLWGSGSGILRGQQRMFEADELVEIIRWRAKSVKKGEEPQSPAEGFTVWLDPNPIGAKR